MPQLKHKENLTKHLNNLLKETGFDPRLKKQFIFDERELLSSDGEFEDVANDKKIKKAKGVLHRYPTKILIFPSEACIGHCRFCFRKHIKKDHVLSNEEFDYILEYLHSNPQINEVIFSGGDPFTIPNNNLLKMIHAVKQIPTIEIVRIHSRVLTFNPELITDSFIETLSKYQPIFMVFHINSHLELTELARAKVKKIVDNGILCFSQTALLKGVNNSFDDLRNLFEILIKNRIVPYYLFHPDKVKGTSHFYISIEEGVSLYRKLYNNISGLAIPVYLFNVPEGNGHCIIDTGSFVKTSEGQYKIHTWDNKIICYHD